MKELAFIIETGYSYPCFTCGNNIGKHFEKWISRSEMWKLMSRNLTKILLGYVVEWNITWIIPTSRILKPL